MATSAMDFDEHDADNALQRHRAGRKSTLMSVAVNVMLTCVQLVAGVFAGSQALIADGIHSLSDLVSDFVVLFASHHSRKEADADHAYGHLRYENAASLVLGGLLIAVGAGMLWSALQKIQTPHAVPAVRMIALWVALGALAAKEMLFRTMLAVAEKLRSSLLVANAWHARSEAASSQVVAIGIGGYLLGFSLLDPIVALIVGLMVLKMGGQFFLNALLDLMDMAVSEEETAAIRATLLSTPGVLGVHALRTRKLGDMAIIDVHLEVDAHQTVAQGHDIAVDARRRVLDQHSVLDVMTHVGPVAAR